MFEFLFNYSRDDYARSELVFTADWPAWLPWALLVAAAVGIAWALLRRRGTGSPLHLITLGLLQLAMIALVIVVLLQPALRTEQLKPGENVVARVIAEAAIEVTGFGDIVEDQHTAGH
mgnify:CR=1 FL=1